MSVEGVPEYANSAGKRLSQLWEWQYAVQENDGRVSRREAEVARARLLGTQDAQDIVTLTLVSDIASDYFLPRDLNPQLEITKETVRTQEDSVKLTQMRLQHWVATTLDVLQARQVLDTTYAQTPILNARSDRRKTR